MTIRLQRRTVAFFALATVVVITWIAMSSAFCVTAWFRHGVALNHCPDGNVRPSE